MASSIFSSNTSEQRWVDQLNQHFTIYVENPPSIFQVPKIVSDTNPEAYSPQKVGIGAFHHLRPDLEEMQSEKLEAVKGFLSPEQYQNFKSLIVDKENNIQPDDRDLTEDILMMENQLPCIVLKEINKSLNTPPNEGKKDEIEDGFENMDEKLFAEMVSFCESHSPLDLVNSGQMSVFGGTKYLHILDVMYNLMIYTMSSVEPVVFFSAEAGFPGGIKQVAQVAGDLTGLKPLLLLANLPLEEFFGLLKKKDNANGIENSSIQEINIPSASQLHRALKIQFKKRAAGFSANAVKYEEQNRTLYLPVIRLNTDSEAILRNLVAYELASGSNNVISSYLDFMCGIIDTAEDVEFLKANGIIESPLPSEEIAKIFNGMNKSSGMEADFEGIVEKLNEDYENTFRVKCWSFINDHLVPSEATAKLILGILLILLLTLQAFCQVYGCSARWFGKISSI
ncbi:OLC1v1008101C1 [Oldenlandia corymbosa var. corymbosa]|uniref:OLC1v1008101C1 n=1 Tax=Oldenlandia corymbosa var. corymbosa TaxID=529605 RepID=A0AAV1DL08_OLDCO|nr:OLC1v1008101C1 [Oldenlandia corymbosa var. corymbosa]